MINEVCANPAAGQDNWPDGRIDELDRAIELFNPTESWVDLEDYVLCTDVCLRLKGRVRPRSYKVLYNRVDWGAAISPYAREYRLEYDGPEGEPAVQSVFLNAQNPGYCWQRIYDAAPTWVERRWPTLGSGNSVWATTPTPTASWEG